MRNASYFADLRSHPRLVLTDERISSLKLQVQADEFSASLLARFRRMAETYLQQSAPVRQVEGRRLLGVSRRVLSHVAMFALLGRITGESRYIDAARREMLVAARFSDWNPSHFLDVAEMAMALAIGYDWLYDDLAAEERAEIQLALLGKAVKPSLAEDWFWISGENNWNPVCHAGLVFAALAVMDDEPELAHRIIDRATANVPRVADAYGPDGAYDEGPMYWDYGTSFLVLLCAAMESATGSAFDPGIPGLLSSADYMMHVTAPTGQFYNYSDCRTNRSPTAALFWFAGKLRRPSLTEIDRAKLLSPDVSRGEGDRLLPFALIWHQPINKADVDVLPTAWTAQGRTPVALMRTRWGDSNAAFLGIKGGSPSNSHAHMDAGSFVFESDGVRWAMDLPMQDYHLLEAAGVNLWDGSQNGDRWKVFRNSSAGHNVLRFNNAQQAVNGMATLQFVSADGAVGRAVVDLSSMYPGLVTSAIRTATLNEDGSAEITDAWQSDAGGLLIQWQWMTAARVEVQSSSFVLHAEEKKLRVGLHASSGPLTITAERANDLRRPFDGEMPGITRVLVTCRARAGSLTARLIPGSLQI